MNKLAHETHRVIKIIQINVKIFVGKNTFSLEYTMSFCNFLEHMTKVNI